MTFDSVVVVGGGLAALRCCEALRRSGLRGPVRVIADEKVAPYDRPPLSKELLRGEWEPDRIALRGDSLAPSSLDDLDLDLRLGVRATSLRVAGSAGTGGTVELDDGSSIEGDAVVLATGASARPLPGAPDLDGLHMLRTLDDALAIRADLAARDRLVVVGGGFIGAEVAASAHTLGLQVTILEALPVPLSRVLGDEMGTALAALHADHGVEVQTSVRVDGFVGDGRVSGVEITRPDMSTEVVPAGVVVIGIGAVPNTSWLEGSGLTIDDGVRCDDALRAAPGVWAVGDVARWPNPLFGEEMRVEHWTNAVESALHVAAAVTAGPDTPPVPFAPVPYVWSDQYDDRIVHVGRNRADDRVVVLHGSIDERRFVAGYEREGRLVAALSLNDPRRLMRYRRLLADGSSWDDALALAAELA
ncbi:MAG TPA: FAD-dependent oxidoreductase [Acidimicrobiales bacterium]